MPVRHEPARDEELIRYLLGELPEEATERLDELSVVDDQFVARLRVVEDDLLDAYASGRLTGDRRRRFEAFYLTSPRRRTKVAFARRFLAAIDPGARPVDETAPETRRHSRLSLVPFPWALAAAVALCLATGGLLMRDARLRRDLADARRQVTTADERLATLSNQLTAQQRIATAAQASLSEAHAAPAVALVLLPQTRGVGPVPAVAVPADATTITVALAIEGAAHGRYEASLKDPASNDVVWHSAPVPAALAEPVPLVTLGLPAPLLKAQHYVVDLFTSASSRGRDFVGSYAFEVVRR